MPPFVLTHAGTPVNALQGHSKRETTYKLILEGTPARVQGVGSIAPGSIQSKQVLNGGNNGTNSPSLLSRKAALQRPKERVLPQLWRTRHQVQIQVVRGFYRRFADS
jgi:hypothetical protein